jgi:uncharacterized protein YegP (UPF0339 family)
MKIEIVKTGVPLGSQWKWKSKYFFRLITKNGRTLVESKNYKSKQGCRSGVNSLIEGVGYGMPVVEVSEARV